MYNDLKQNVIIKTHYVKKTYIILGNNAKVFFDGNWFAFLENLIQISVFQMDNYNLYFPKFVKKVVIDPIKQQKQAEISSNGKSHTTII